MVGRRESEGVKVKSVDGHKEDPRLLVARPCIESGRKNSKKRKHILVQTTRNK
jgi:hypothetical protein